MINISYLIKRVLGEYDKIRADKIQLNLSEKTLKFYDEWYEEYYYQNKIEEISKIFDLEIMPEVCLKLKLKLQKIDHVIEKINEKMKSKRMINISYLIKRVLGEYDKTEADKIQLNLSEKTLKFYDKWYEEYYYQNKIEEINKKFDLEITPEVCLKLTLKLQKIDHVIEKINEKMKRKRKINISYVIKRVLGEYDKTEADKIQLNLSEKNIEVL